MCVKLHELILSSIKYQNTGVSNLATEEFKKSKPNNVSDLMNAIQNMCELNDKRIVLAMDEIDMACNSQPFLDFLGSLRDYFLYRKSSTFISVILAGVRDVRNLKSKIRSEGSSVGEANSPWNIATDFTVDMNFSIPEISGMLDQYEADHHIDLDIPLISGLLKEYTGGYPYLVSRICSLMDKDISENIGGNKKAAWSREGFLEAVRLILRNHSLSLFQSLLRQLEDNLELKNLLKRILLVGESLNYRSVPYITVEQAIMHGFIKVMPDDSLAVSNRIFETYLYDVLMHEGTSFEQNAKNDITFVKDRTIDMELVLTRFSVHYNKEFEPRDKISLEHQARRLFMTFLKPIINGQGNYYIEAQTRSTTRIDLVIDLFAKQYVVELKIWHGLKYVSDGAVQLADYLDRFGLDTGYLLVFSNLKRKNVRGRKELRVNGKRIILVVT
jgi:hypothetical protein